MAEFTRGDLGKYKDTFLTFVQSNEHGESVWTDANDGFIFFNKIETKKIKLHIPEPDTPEIYLLIQKSDNSWTGDTYENLIDAQDDAGDFPYQRIAKYRFVEYV